MFASRLMLLLFIGSFVISAGAADVKTYSPAKVVYDVSSADADELNRILDRASLLQNIYGHDPFAASIIIVVHEGAIPLLVNPDNSQPSELILRAGSLAMGDIIQFRVCSASARMQGFDKNDFPEFITMVPMADAEIIQLQNDNYAYLR